MSEQPSTSTCEVRLAVSSTREWVSSMVEKLILGECLTTADLSQIIKRSVAILQLESSLLELKSTDCRVVGKLFGNWKDLLRIFRQFGWPSNTTYVFLGNYLWVDQLDQLQIRVLLMLLLFKIVYPGNILMLRGLSECEHCAADMGLIDVCFDQFSGNIYQDLVELFKYLPLAAEVGGQYFLSCESLSMSRGYLIDYEVVDRPMTTCSRLGKRLAYEPNRLSMVTLRRFRKWDRKQDCEDYKQLRLFLKWNGLRSVVKSADIDLVEQKCPTVEGPQNSLVSFHSASSMNASPANGTVMAIHRNLCCTFHSVRFGDMTPTVRMLFPDPFVRSESLLS